MLIHGCKLHIALGPPNSIVLLANLPLTDLNMLIFNCP